ncbi:hypothetical protein BN946_scf184940.g33 [Trametes cinnabarina]|uniref:Glyoxalase-like domain-containing protein n=1 Tax=Pycnoporus cinnabarinus TaxID=5643 RepID=A0A060SCF9_PYCCI|nr:hypothetical protein BN946_scf184940.g33 [Trametes cinnabarina]
MSEGLSTRILDHIVHLSPPGTLEDSADAFRKLGFTVTPGGTHADGQTANALIIFADGTYLELLHFTHAPPASTAHPWAHKPPGWIDYAFLGNAGTPSVADTINRRAAADGSGVRYAPEVRGGRTRADDGRVLEWLITAPAPSEGNGTRASARGRLPFFCGDVTPREWRVPLEPRSNAEHASKARGVAYVKLLVLPSELDAYAKELTSVLGVSPAASSASQVVWELERQPSDSQPYQAPTLVLNAAEEYEEEIYVRERGAGIYELGVAVEDAGKAGVAYTPYGRVVWQAIGSR